MRRLLLATILGVGLLGAVPAKAELDEFAMTNWEMVAAACAKYQQIFAAYCLDDLFSDLEDRIVGHARDQEASEAQLAVLERRFEEGRTAAVESGYTPGSRADQVDKGRLEYLQARADQVEEICTRSYQSLALMAAQPVEGGGLNERAMNSWRDLAVKCGGWEVSADVKGFHDRISNLMAETLGNARGQGASDWQMDELAREYERGRAEQREVFRKLEEKHGHNLDWAETSQMLRENTEQFVGVIWKLCALNER